MNQNDPRINLHLALAVAFYGRVETRLIRDFKSDNKGVTMIEYALIAGLISVVAILLLTAMGSSVKNIFTSINSALTTA